MNLSRLILAVLLGLSITAKGDKEDSQDAALELYDLTATKDLINSDDIAEIGGGDRRLRTRCVRFDGDGFCVRRSGDRSRRYGRRRYGRRGDRNRRRRRNKSGGRRRYGRRGDRNRRRRRDKLGVDYRYRTGSRRDYDYDIDVVCRKRTRDGRCKTTARQKRLIQQGRRRRGRDGRRYRDYDVYDRRNRRRRRRSRYIDDIDVFYWD